MSAVLQRCPSCNASLGDGFRFCEECGFELNQAREVAEQSAAVASVVTPGGPLVQVDEPDLSVAAGQCTECGGQVAPDGYCGQCGSPAPAPRDHWLERPASWVAAMCDRGVRHPHNEDAVAVAAGPVPGSFAALIVCDGVSSSTASDVASLVAVRAARDVLVAVAVPEPQRDGARAASSALDPPATPTPPAPGVSSVPGVPSASTVPAPSGAAPQQAVQSDPEPTASEGSSGSAEGPSGSAEGPSGSADDGSIFAGFPSGSVRARAGVLASRIVDAGLQANAAVVASAGDPPRPNPPSCTFAAALVEGPLLVAGWAGDSRVYWLPDAGRAVQVSSDDSWAGEAIAAGIPREDAERAPQSHAITRWFGVDAPDPRAHTAIHRLEGSGWVLVCSDGLWNYCSPAAELQGLLAGTVQRTGADPAALASELVAWAKLQGGHDNITVALARVGRHEGRDTDG